MSHPVDVGGVVPLFYLSPYKKTTLYVRARIYNSISGALLATKDLTHISDGRYTDATFFMPDIAGIEVRHDVYTDAGYSIRYDLEGSIEERFHRLITDPALIRNDELVLTFDDTGGGDEVYMTFTDDGLFMSIGADEGLSMSFSDADQFDMTFVEGDETIFTFYDC